MLPINNVKGTETNKFFFVCVCSKPHQGILKISIIGYRSRLWGWE